VWVCVREMVVGMVSVSRWPAGKLDNGRRRRRAGGLDGEVLGLAHVSQQSVPVGGSGVSVDEVLVGVRAVV
jgi:hypothetical protein